MTNRRSIQNGMDGLDLKIDHLGPIETASRGIDKIPATAKKLSKPLGAIALGTALALGSVAPAHGQDLHVTDRQDPRIRGRQEQIDRNTRAILDGRYAPELRIQAIIDARATQGFTQLSESEQIRLINQLWLDAVIERQKDILVRHWPLIQIELDTGNARAGDRFVGDIEMDIQIILITRRETEQETQQSR